MLGKIVERAGYDQLQVHCESNGLISKDQHGGRPRHSTQTCLIEIQENYLQAKSEGNKCALLAVDLSAAYDLVCHDVMDQQLRVIAGADPLVRKWSKSFLTDRKQMCEIEGQASKLIQSLRIGLCQGGRSSGTLFAIHTNGISEATRGKLELGMNHQGTKPISKKVGNKIIKQFIDDTTGLAIAKTFTELKETLQQMYNNLEEHLINLGMSVNPSKTQMMILNPGTLGKVITIEAGGAVINHQKTMKILGFTFNQEGTMDDHIWRGDSNMVKSIRFKQSMLSKIKPFTTPEQLNKITNAVTNTLILYLAPLWS